MLYQLGNSPTHAATLELLQKVPGVVMLHDFYLSGLKSWLQEHAHQAGAWSEALYASHGYKALQDWSKDAHFALQKYPVNLPELQAAIQAGAQHWDQWHTVAGAGHWVQYEAADAFNAALGQALRA